jgi:hypothetical protein
MTALRKYPPLLGKVPLGGAVREEVLIEERRQVAGNAFGMYSKAQPG